MKSMQTQINFQRRNNLAANKDLVSSLIFCAQFVYVFQIAGKLLHFIFLFGFILDEINISVADPGFPRGGGANRKGGGANLLFGQFFPKTA